MSEQRKDIKFQLMLSPEEAAAIDEWSFKNRIRTRAGAIRRLCHIGQVATEQALAILKATVASEELLNRLRENSFHELDNSDSISRVDTAKRLTDIQDGMVELLEAITTATEMLEIRDFVKVVNELKEKKEKSASLVQDMFSAATQPPSSDPEA